MSDIKLPDLEQQIKLLIQEANKQKVSAAEASISSEKGLAINVRNGEIETLEHHNDQGVMITVYQGQSKGTVSTSDVSEQALKEAVKQACSIAKHTAQDPFSGLVEKSLMADSLPDLDLSHPWQLSVDEYIELAQKTEAAALAYDKRISNSEGASLNTHIGAVAYGNTHGFIGAYPVSRHSLSCSVIAASDQKMQRDYWYDVTRDPELLADADAIGKKAAERAVKRLNAQKIQTGQSPVIFVPDMARTLIAHFLGAIRGSSVYRKASFLLDHIDQKIFPDFIQMSEQPHLLKGIGSAPFDAEGVGTQTRDWIKQGVLLNYILDGYSARKLGLTTTGNAGGVRNLIVSSNHAGGLDALSAEMNQGLIVTELMGQGVNTVTGDYSRGASGFWVENGEIQFPVEEITIAGNLKDMFLGIASVSDDIDSRGNVQVGSMLIDNMMIAGE